MAKKNTGEKTVKLTADEASKIVRDSLDVIESRFATVFTMLENQNILMGELADDAETLSNLETARANLEKKNKKEKRKAEKGEAAPDTVGSNSAVVDFSEIDLNSVAADLGALGHPVRLEIIRLCLNEPRRVRDVAETLGHGTTGQIYHHLRQLTTAGWLTSAGSNTYQVNDERRGALATILGALP